MKAPIEEVMGRFWEASNIIAREGFDSLLLPVWARCTSAALWNQLTYFQTTRDVDCSVGDGGGYELKWLCCGLRGR